MSAAKHVFSTSRFDQSEYTYIKTTEYNDLCMKLDRANAEAADVTRRLQICDEHYVQLVEEWAELRHKSQICEDQYKQLWAEWTQLCTEWANLKTENKKLQKELAARNSPATTQGTHTISNESRPQYITRPALCSRCATRR